MKTNNQSGEKDPPKENSLDKMMQIGTFPSVMDTIAKVTALICKADVCFVTIRNKEQTTIIGAYGKAPNEIPKTLICNHFSPQNSLKVFQFSGFSGENTFLAVLPEPQEYQFYGAIFKTMVPHSVTLEVLGKNELQLQKNQLTQMEEGLQLIIKELDKENYLHDLETRNHQFEKFFLRNLDILVIINRNGKISKVNEQWTETLGYIKAETIDTSFLDYIHPEDKKNILPVITLIFKKKKIMDFEIRFKNKHGNYRTLEWRAYSDGEQIFASARDITEKQKKESEIQRLTNLLFDAQAIARLGAWELDLGTGQTTWTEEVYKIHELESDFEPNLVSGIEFYHPDDRLTITNALEATVNSGKPFEVTCRLITAKNNIRWVRASGRMVTYANHSSRIIGTFQDITQKTIEDQEKEYNTLLLNGLFERSPIGIALIDFESGRFSQVNQRFVSQTGYTQNELEKLHLWELMRPEDAIRQKNILNALKPLQYYGPTELLYLRKDGLEYPAIISGVVLTDGHGKHKFWSFIEDISERKHYELKISESLSKLQGIMDASTQVCIITTDQEGRIQNFNRGAELLLGYPSADLINKAFIEMLQPQPQAFADEFPKEQQQPETIEKRTSAIIEKLNGGNSLLSGEWSFLKKNQVRVPVFLNITPIFQQNIKTGYLFVANDITPIKKVNEELRFLLDLSKNQNERLKNFANIVSHNLKSHSGNIDALIQFLLEEMPELQEQELVKMIKLASDHLKETIAHLSEVALVNSNEQQPQIRINVYEVISKAIDSVQALAIKESVQIINTIDQNEYIYGIPAYIDSIILNFLTNGIKYRSQERESFIKLSLNEDNGYKILSIEDNGLGIDLEKYGTKLFGLYKTFHRKKDSQGIGLFITKNQVESMGGFIEVVSKVNEGTTFKIFLKANQQG